MALLHLDPLPRNATPGEVLRFVAGIGKLEGKRVGKIALLGNGATVEVPDTHAAKLVATLDGATFRERPVRARLANTPNREGTEHFDQLARLLQLEADAEREQIRERAARGTAADGTSLTHLTITEDDTGFGGRLILTFTRSGPLPPNRLQPGTPVVLTQTGTSRPLSLRGVVSDRGERTISVAFDRTDLEWPDDAQWRLDLSPDEASRQRQLAALARVASANGDRLAELRAILMGEKPPEFEQNEAEPEAAAIESFVEFWEANPTPEPEAAERLIARLQDTFGLAPFYPANLQDHPPGWVQITDGRPTTGRVRSVLRPGLTARTGELRIPARVVVE